MKPKKLASPPPKPVDALVYPRFSGVPTFMRLPYIPRAEELDIALIGVPFDGSSTYRPGPRFGARNSRVQSAKIRPWHPALNVSPFDTELIADLSDASLNLLAL